MRNAQNLGRHELIGLEVEVVHGGLSGLSGKIVDETRNMLLVETKAGVKKVAKTGSQFLFPKYATVLGGKEILARPEERIKQR